MVGQADEDQLDVSGCAQDCESGEYNEVLRWEVTIRRAACIVFTMLLVYSGNHSPFSSHGLFAEFLFVPLLAAASCDAQIDCNKCQA